MSVYELARNDDRQGLADVLDSADAVAVRRRAAQALADTTDRDPTEGGLQRSVLETLMDHALSDPDEQVRALAIDAIETLAAKHLNRLAARATDQTPSNISPRTYAQLTQHTRPELRMVGLVGIGHCEANQLGRFVIECLDDSDPRVRERAARIAGQLELEDAARPLLNGLSDEVARARAECARALGEIKREEAVGPVAELLEDDTESVRFAAIEALGAIGSPRAIEPIAGALEDQTAINNRMAVFALVEVLSNTPLDQADEVRAAVLAATAGSVQNDVVDTLIDLTDSINHSSRKRQAIWLLGQLTEQTPVGAAVDTLLEALEDEDARTAEFAITSLSKCPTRLVEPRAIERLYESDPGSLHRARLITLLGLAGTADARAPIKRIREETESSDIAEQATAALSRLRAD